MIEKIIYFVYNLSWILYCLPEYLGYKFELDRPDKAQNHILLSIIKNNRSSEFGRKYNFSQIKKIEDYQSKVPISIFKDYQGYIERIKSKRNNVLTSLKVLRLIPTSGSVLPSKEIPFTNSLKRQFHRAIAPWIVFLYFKNPKLLFTKIYWSITPALVKNDSQNNVGFGDDTEYFSFFEKFILKQLLIVPHEVSLIKDLDTFRYVTLLFLLNCRKLGLISIWNPMFLTLILDKLINWLPMLIKDLDNSQISGFVQMPDLLKEQLINKLRVNKSRVKELKSIYKKHSQSKIKLIEEIWPQLELISCWSSAKARNFIDELKAVVGEVNIQPKGLMATEGVVSLPFYDQCLLAVTSHFFEFIELGSQNNPRPKLVSELEIGKQYSVLITTGGGLYRYNLEDIVEVVGFYKKTPSIKFIGKLNHVSDLVGEKLNSHHVETVLDRLFKKYSINPKFFLLAPERIEANKLCYVLFLKLTDNFNQNLSLLPKELDFFLSENIHYQYCRKLEQLSQIKVFIIDSYVDPVKIYLAQKAKFNQTKLGNIKTYALDNNFGWLACFSGNFVDHQPVENR